MHKLSVVRFFRKITSGHPVRECEKLLEQAQDAFTLDIYFSTLDRKLLYCKIEDLSFEMNGVFVYNFHLLEERLET